MLKTINIKDNYIGAGTLLKFNSMNEHYSYIINSKYVLAPAGTGLDTHRFWEAQYLGAIPITKRHIGLEIFETDNSIMVDNWHEVEMKIKLHQKRGREVPIMQNKKIWFQYWEQIITETSKKY